MAGDDSEALVEVVREAHAQRMPLSIVGSGSKSFLLPAGEPVDGRLLSTAGHTGIVDYRPEELVVTARAGLPLRELATALGGHGQMLPFDPPLFGGEGTVGGVVAAGLSGPGRPWLGSVRDALLGVELVNGLGERLHFGGQVMKNVAGYDVSRLQAGAFGTLGVILAASFRLRPQPAAERTCVLEQSLPKALATVRELFRRPFPVSATCADGWTLRVRLSGAEQAVLAACRRVGGDVEESGEFWQRLRDHRLAPLGDRHGLWRVSVPPATPPMPGERLVEWAGALRWVTAADSGGSVAEQARGAGGWAAPFGSGFALAPAMDATGRRLHLRVKAAFDPDHVLNRELMADRWDRDED